MAKVAITTTEVIVHSFEISVPDDADDDTIYEAAEAFFTNFGPAPEWFIGVKDRYHEWSKTNG